MIQTIKRVVSISGLKIGLASVQDEHGKAFVQVAILYGNQYPIASSSLYFPATSIKQAEDKIINLTDSELDVFIRDVRSYDSFSNSLSSALKHTQLQHPTSSTPQTHKPPVMVRKSYKRMVN